MRYSRLLATVLSPRGQAVLRRDFPFFHPSVSLIAGQFTGFFAPQIALLLSLLLPALAIFGRKRTRLRSGLFHMVSGFFLLGIFTSFLTFQSPKIPLESSYSHLLKVTEEPRFSTPGIMNLSIVVLASKDEDSNYTGLTRGRPPRFRCRAVHLPWKNAYSLKEGSIFTARATFRPFPAKQTSYSRSLARKGFSGTCTIRYAGIPVHNTGYLSGKREHLRSSVRKVLGSDEGAAMILSMSFGQKDLITRRTEEAFRRTGLSHLLVVSGYHVALIFGLSFFILKSLFLRINLFYQLCIVPHLCAISSVFLTLFYVAIVGSSGSSLRAACAISFLMVARVLERGGGMLNAFWISILVLLLLWPGSFMDLGIQLTYSSLLGIYLGLSSSDQSNVRNLAAGWKSKALMLKSVLYQYVKVCTWATTTSSIVVLVWLDYFSLAGYITNPLLAPVLALISCKMGAIAVIANSLGIDSDGYFLRMLSPVVSMLKDLVTWIADFKYASIHTKGTTYFCLLVSLSLVSLRAILFRIKLYFLNRGIWQS